MPFRRGIKELNQTIAATKTSVVRLRRFERLLRETESRRLELVELIRQLERERDIQKDTVERLEGYSLRAALTFLLGARRQMLEDERRELRKTEAELSDATGKLEAMGVEIAGLTAETKLLAAAQKELLTLLDEKDRWIRAHDARASKKLVALGKRSADLTSRIDTIQAALDAGEVARGAMSTIRSALDRASSWNLEDLLIGGRLMSRVTGAELAEIRTAVRTASSVLNQFAQALGECGFVSGVDVYVISTRSFSNDFLGELVFDWTFRSRIRATQKDVVTVEDHINSILATLKEHHTAALKEIDDVEMRRDVILDQWS